MKTRTVLLVIGTTAALFLGGLLLVILLGRGLQALRESISNEQSRQKFVARWQPPSELKPDLLFPPEVGGRLAGPTETHRPPQEPAFGLAGLQTSYRKLGRPDITIFAGRANELEAEAIVRRTRDLYSTRGGTKTISEVPGRLRLSFSDPPETMELWTLHDWLFLYRSPGELEAEFIRLHLAAIGTPKPD